MKKFFFFFFLVAAVVGEGVLKITPLLVSKISLLQVHSLKYCSLQSSGKEQCIRP